jgi:hypothetical protein
MWDGSVKAQQSFFGRSMSVDDVQSAIGDVMRQNRDTLIQRGLLGCIKFAAMSMELTTCLVLTMDGLVNSIQYGKG